MRFSLIILFSFVLLANTLESKKLNPRYFFYGDDVFEIKKSDTAIKPLVFPKSMTVIRECYPENWGCLLLDPEPGMGHIDKAVVENSKYIHEAIDNEKAIKKYLVRLDPTRIAPSKRGKDHEALSILNEMDISKRVLKELGKQYDTDFIFVFRRTIFHISRPRYIRTEGRIYLVRQDKLLVMPSNDQILELDVTDLQKRLQDINRNGLQQLAKDARKVILSHKFEKRRSNY